MSSETMVLNNELESELKLHGADFVHFVDISQLPVEQNKHFPNAILIGIALSPDYLRKITRTTNYLKKMKDSNFMNEDEFHLREAEADRLADYIAQYIRQKGYAAYSQSEDNTISTGFYDEKAKTTPLPHKTIAVMAGLGWIGKHNLLITPEFGSAVCMCTVLTDAPLKTALNTPVNSLCGSCSVCTNICPTEAIKGKTWDIGISRDELVDVYKCTTCMECLAYCPWTQTYMKKNRLA
jgi:epoxyqueuosine reductase QueG